METTVREQFLRPRLCETKHLTSIYSATSTLIDGRFWYDVPNKTQARARTSRGCSCQRIINFGNFNSGVELVAVLYLSATAFVCRQTTLAEMGVAGAQSGLPAARRGRTAAAVGLGYVLEEAGNAGISRLRSWFGREFGPTLSLQIMEIRTLPSSLQYAQQRTPARVECIGVCPKIETDGKEVIHGIWNFRGSYPVGL